MRRLLLIAPLAWIFLTSCYGFAREVVVAQSDADSRMVGAAEPAKPSKESPLTPQEQAQFFSLPPGYSIELVASEPDIGKPVTVVWDANGRMWTMTALEYPVDANEDPARSRELFTRGGRDKVLVFDHPYGVGPHKPRVFADKLAMPLGLLPYKDGAYVQYGSKILFLRDTDGDGKADKREVVLEGFGTEDSHLFPHQFTRGPGDWIYIAQGAFNHSRVRSKEGPIVHWSFCKMARFKPDGRRFEVIEAGLNNIWGFVINREGEMFIQEANDLGYPMTPFMIGMNFPGIGMEKLRNYAPWQPALAHFQMGGTGLSGLALAEDRGSWPAPYTGIFYLANPITSKIQAIRVSTDGSHYKLDKLPDFILSSDPWFRPVSIHFGPDGCLYITDWYNKIISHNEVPRNHPDRDKTRGRIWRVRHSSQPNRPVKDFAKLPNDKLLESLGSESLWENRTAWQQITDRSATTLVPELKKIVVDAEVNADRRIAALWSLENLKSLDVTLILTLVKNSNRNIRREAVRALDGFAESDILATVIGLVEDPDPQVRAEAIRAISSLRSPSDAALELLIRFGKAPIDGPIITLEQGSVPAKTGDAHDRDFERYLVRMGLEQYPKALSAFLQSEKSKALPFENVLLASLALDSKVAAVHLAKVLPSIGRSITEAEILPLLTNPNQPGVKEAVHSLLENPKVQRSIASLLIRLRTQFESAPFLTILTQTARSLWEGDEKSKELSLELATAFKLGGMESILAEVLSSGSVPGKTQIAALRALREMNASRVSLFQQIIERNQPGGVVREEAVLALASSTHEKAANQFFELASEMTAKERRMGLALLSSNNAGAHAILDGIRKGVISEDALDGSLVERLQILLGDSAGLSAMLKNKPTLFRPVLRLDGKNSYAKTDIALSGPFTVESWVRLDTGIGNLDSILGNRGVADFNFHDGKLRFWTGLRTGDAIIAQKNIVAETWTHYAVTRDSKNMMRIYRNGELDTDRSKYVTADYKALQIGASNQGFTTAGALSEIRIWNRARHGDEILADFDHSFEGKPLPQGLMHYYPGAGPWGTLMGNAKILWTNDFPPIVSNVEAEALTAKFARYRSIVRQEGDVAHGKLTFTKHCLTCHAVQGKGGNIGPSLSGAGAMGNESLLRNILTPSAAMEAGYRNYVVLLRSGAVKDGYLAGQTDEFIILRRPNFQDERINHTEILQSRFTRRSIMPDNIQDAMSEADFRDLFAYLRTLK